MLMSAGRPEKNGGRVVFQQAAYEILSETEKEEGTRREKKIFPLMRAFNV